MKNTISFNTKFGWISATEEGSKITKILFAMTKNDGFPSKNLRRVKKKYISYFNSKNEKMGFPIKLTGNCNQKKIWAEIKKIKKGKVKSYGQIAKKLKFSPRYVGRVCGENKHVIVVPCHRVIRSDGSLGGFSAKRGIRLKISLLKLENSNFYEK